MLAGAAGWVIRARLRGRLVSPNGGAAASWPQWLQGFATALAVGAGTEQCSQPDPRTVEQNPLIPGADPELLGCIGRREALDVTQGDDLGVPGRKRGDSGEDGARCLVGNDQIFRPGNVRGRPRARPVGSGSGLVDAVVEWVYRDHAPLAAACRLCLVHQDLEDPGFQ